MLSIETRVADLVLDHSECAAVFDRYRIDYCCKGNRTLRDACTERGLDPRSVLEDCNLAIFRRVTDEVDPRTLSTRLLITSVIAKHHRYLHRTLPFLETLSAKVARVHGNKNPALRDVAQIVEALVEVFLDHLHDEEHHLFPALLAADAIAAAPHLTAMRAEHEDVGAMLSVLRAVCEDYVAPDWACNSYKALLAELAYLEADTMRHVHLENHVLLPRFTASA